MQKGLTQNQSLFLQKNSFQSIQGTISSRQQTIHTGNLPAGSYLLRLTNGQTVTIIK